MRYPILALISIDQIILNCVSPLRGFPVKIESLQIKQNVPNLK